MPRIPALVAGDVTLYKTVLTNGIKSFLLNAPPGGPASGDCYIVGTSPSGAWVGSDNKIAIYNGATWDYIPTTGAIGTTHRNLVAAQNGGGETYRWFGTEWTKYAAPGSVNELNYSYDPHPQYATRDELSASGTDLTYTAATRLLASSTGADATLPLFSSTDAGLAPASGGGTANYLRADGTWVAPGGSGDMVLASAQTNTGAKTFLDTTLLMRNVANTFSSTFTNTNTAARTYTLKDANGTIAFTSDITGTNSGTNTGDQTSIVGISGTFAQFNTAVTDADLAGVDVANSFTAVQAFYAAVIFNPVPAGGSRLLVNGYNSGSGGANVAVYIGLSNYNNDGLGDGFSSTFARGTIGAPTAVSSGDQLSTFQASGYDGSAYQTTARIAIYADGAVSAGNVPTRIVFETGPGSTKLERLRVSSDGNIRHMIADAGASAGPVYDLFRDSASPAASDIIGQVKFSGRDSAANAQDYATINAIITDATSTSEDASLAFNTVLAGTMTESFRLTGSTGRLYSNDAGATVGPLLDMFRDSASPAASDVIGEVQFTGRDSAANIQEYANIAVTITDATSASEDADILFSAVGAGTLAERFRIGGFGGLGIGGANYGTSGQFLKSAGNAAAPAWATIANADIPNGINNASRTGQSQVVVSGTAYYITRSDLTLPATPLGGMVVGTTFTWRLSMTKTAAGTGTFQIRIYRGTNGSTADTADVTQSIGTQTAVVDMMTVDVTVVVTATGATGSYYWTICPMNRASTAATPAGFGVPFGTTGFFEGTVSSVALNTASLKFGLAFIATTGTPTIRVPSVVGQVMNMS